MCCRLMLAALVVLFLMAMSSYSALFCCCFATDYYGLWLQTYHRKDLACLRILVGLTSVLPLRVVANYVFTFYYGSYVNNNLCVANYSYVQVQNGLAVYSTWISIASLINFALVLHLWGVDRSTAATASLCILFAEVVLW